MVKNSVKKDKNTYMYIIILKYQKMFILGWKKMNLQLGTYNTFIISFNFKRG